MTKTHDRLSFVKSIRNWSNDDRFSLADSWSAFSLRGNVAGEERRIADAPAPDLQISLTGSGVPYSQDFNTLASAGTSSTVPADWAFSETGTAANATYTAGTGSGNTGDTYSFGAAAAADRALGGLQSGALIPTFGASFTNNTGATITSLADRLYRRAMAVRKYRSRARRPPGFSVSASTQPA